MKLEVNKLFLTFFFRWTRFFIFYPFSRFKLFTYPGVKQRIFYSIPPHDCFPRRYKFRMGFSGLNGVPVIDDITKEKIWSKCVPKYQRKLLVSAADNNNKQRLLASNGNTSGAWLNAIPMSSIGLINTKLRTAVASIIGCKMFIQHSWICGETVDNFGLYRLSLEKFHLDSIGILRLICWLKEH